MGDLLFDVEPIRSKDRRPDLPDGHIDVSDYTTIRDDGWKSMQCSECDKKYRVEAYRMTRLCSCSVMMVDLERHTRLGKEISEMDDFREWWEDTYDNKENPLPYDSEQSYLHSFEDIEEETVEVEENDSTDSDEVEEAAEGKYMSNSVI